MKQDRLSEEGYAALIASTTRLNAVGARLSDITGVHAVTDVTGFGLLGHTLEMARGAGLSAEIWADQAPLHPGVEALARAGVRTGAAVRNWASYGADVDLPAEMDLWRRDILCDPQTSGGLLISAAPEAEEHILSLTRNAGLEATCIVGRMEAGAARVRVTAR